MPIYRTDSFSSGCGGSSVSWSSDGQFAGRGVIQQHSGALATWSGEAASPRGVEQWVVPIRKYAEQFDVPSQLIAGIVLAESNGQENAMNFGDNPRGAGLMQITSTYLKEGHSDEQLSHDGDLNIYLGTKFFSQLWTQYNANPVKAIIAYNAGSVICASGRNEWNAVMTGNYAGGVIGLTNYAVQTGLFGPDAAALPGPPPVINPPMGGDTIASTSGMGIGEIAALTFLAGAAGYASWRYFGRRG